MGFTGQQMYVPTAEEDYLMSQENVHVGVPCLTCRTGEVEKFERISTWHALMAVFRLLRFDKVDYLGFSLTNNDTYETSMLLWFSIHLNPLVDITEHAAVLFDAPLVLDLPMFTNHIITPTVKPCVRLMHQALGFISTVLREVIASYMGDFKGLVYDIANLVVSETHGDVDLVEQDYNNLTIYDRDSGPRNLRMMTEWGQEFLNFHDHPGKSVLNPPEEFTLATYDQELEAYAAGMIAEELHRSGQVCLYVKLHWFHDDTNHGITENTGQRIYDLMLRIRERHQVKSSKELVVKLDGNFGEVSLKLTIGWEE
jgi:hypothetical protein